MRAYTTCPYFAKYFCYGMWGFLRALGRVTLTAAFHSRNPPLDEDKCNEGGGIPFTSRSKVDNLDIAQLRAANRLRPVSLPVELLGYVFELACQNIEIARLNTLSIYSISIGVSMVRGTRDAINSTCSWWREVALSTQALWRAIAILDMRDVRYLVDPGRFSAFIRRAGA